MATKNSEHAPASLEIVGSIATITLDRPEAYNAIDIAMARCLEELSAVVEAREDVRVLVLRASGKVFCAGGDVKLFVEHLEKLAPPISELLTHLNDFLLRLRRMRPLVVTSVHGSAAGAGLSLAFIGDFCIAADDARFRPAYAQLGVSPDAGGTHAVVRALGARGALQLFLLEPELSAVRAQELGLVTKAVPAADLDAATTQMVERLAAINPEAAASTKQLVWQSSLSQLDEQLEAESQAILRCMETEEFKAKVRKFASRQPLATSH